MADVKICCAKVPCPGMSFARFRPCKYKGAVKRDGKWYCRRHDPVESAEKKQKSHKKRLNLMRAQIVAHYSLKNKKNQ